PRTCTDTRRARFSSLLRLRQSCLPLCAGSASALSSASSHRSPHIFSSGSFSLLPNDSTPSDSCLVLCLDELDPVRIILSVRPLVVPVISAVIIIIVIFIIAVVCAVPSVLVLVVAGVAFLTHESHLLHVILR